MNGMNGYACGTKRLKVHLKKGDENQQQNFQQPMGGMNMGMMPGMNVNPFMGMGGFVPPNMQPMMDPNMMMMPNMGMMPNFPMDNPYDKKDK